MDFKKQAIGKQRIQIHFDFLKHQICLVEGKTYPAQNDQSLPEEELEVSF